MAKHLPVLLEAVLQGLEIEPDGVYVDATYGRGGHSGGILGRLGSRGRLVAIDRDPEAVAAARARYAGEPRVSVQHGEFGRIRDLLAAAGIEGPVDGVLLDLGLSSPQVDEAARGFSFLRDGPLDMRMNPTRGMGAADWLARAAEREIADVLRDYGEEPNARRVARAIVDARRASPITRTAQLAAIVAAARPGRVRGKHPATRAFQAIRVHVNSELDELRRCLPQCLELLAPGGRLAVLSYHSLEDRVVKRFMREQARVDPRLAKLPAVPAEALPKLRVVGAPVRPGEDEVASNPRARSAVLRVAERVA